MPTWCSTSTSNTTSCFQKCFRWNRNCCIVKQRKFAKTDSDVMPQLSGRQASVYALLVFVLTILLSIFLPRNPIALSGLLVVVFLSVFVPTRSSTIIAGVVSAGVVITFLLWNAWQMQLAEVWTELL